MQIQTGWPFWVVLGLFVGSSMLLVGTACICCMRGRQRDTARSELIEVRAKLKEATLFGGIDKVDHEDV